MTLWGNCQSGKEPECPCFTLPQIASSLRRSFAAPRWWCRGTAIALIAATAIWHVFYLINNCPLDLSADEAHYWDWSRHLDWSYYSKGPLVAWIIRLSRELFGGLSIKLCGTELFAVHFPAVLCGIGLLSGLYVLASRVLSSERLALATVAAALTIPAMTAGASIMTIDAPFCCAWVWALVFAHSAIFRNSRWGWPLAGVAVCLGILAKYTMVIWLGCIGMFLLTTPAVRGELRKAGFWIACLIATASVIPIIIWNAQHGWVTLRHVGWQAGTQFEGVRWFGPVRYIVEQAGLLLIFWFVCWAMAVWRQRPGQASPQMSFLWWTSVPMFAFFMSVTFKTPGQVNWPIAAYVSGLILAVDWLAYRFEVAGQLWCRAHRAFLSLAVCAGLAMTFILHYPAIAQPLFVAISGAPSAATPMPLRKYDPSPRLRGWRNLASAVDELRTKLALMGEDPIIVATYWTSPGELSFYCAGHPDVYCIGPAFGQRYSQYDLWRPNPLWDPQEFKGRSVIVVGDFMPAMTTGFDYTGPTFPAERIESGQVVAYWQLTVCRGYRGFGENGSWALSKTHY